MNINIDEQMAGFDSLYEELLAGRIEAIEYGEESRPGGMFSFLRVRAIPTPGGLQLAVKELSFNAEGSGIYFQMHDKEGLKAHLTQRLTRIHRPTGFSRMLNDSAYPKVSFFAVALVPVACASKDFLSLGKKPVTIVQF